MKAERGTFLLADGKTKVLITAVANGRAIGCTCGPAVLRKFYCCDEKGKASRPWNNLWKRIDQKVMR